MPAALQLDASERLGGRALKDAPAWALDWLKRQRVDRARAEINKPPLALENGDEIDEGELLELAWEDMDLLSQAEIPRSNGNEFFV